MYCLDTNAIIYFLKEDPAAIKILGNIFQRNIPLYISAYTEVELFGFRDLSTFESKRIEEILETITITPLDSRIARIAGYLRRYYRVQAGDSVIGATCLALGTTLLTRNVKDFKKIDNLKIEKI